jgi:hypothetical protein
LAPLALQFELHQYSLLVIATAVHVNLRTSGE